jgi:DNA repair protein RadA/Sms
MHLLLAVLQKYAKVRLDNADVFVNVVGDVDFKDPAIDLAVAAAVVSAKKEKSLGKNTVYCGEIGLLGEVRKVRQLSKRIKEAKRLGYTNIVTVENLERVGEL